MARPRFIALCCLCVAAAAAADCGPKTPADLVAKIASPSYQKANRPGIAAAGSTDAPADPVQLWYDIRYLLGVDQKTQRIETTGVLTGSWTDGRLAFNESCAGAKTMYLPIETRFEIWAPDVYIKNEVLTDVPDEYLVLSVDANGKVMLEREKRLVTKCSMNFRKMPYDIQRCDIVFTLETPGVVLQAAADKLSSKPPGNPEWNVKNLHRKQATATDQEDVLVLKLRRRATYYRKYIIIPVILFVLVSYSSFYVARAAAPARVGLTLIAFLVITNFNASVLSRIPPVDYDVRLLNFLYMSMWFSAFAIFEYAVVNMLFRIEARVVKARDKAEDEAGIKKLEEKREIKRLIKKKAQGPVAAMTGLLRKRPSQKDGGRTETDAPPPDVEAPSGDKPTLDRSGSKLTPERRSTLENEEVQEEIRKEVRIAAGRLGRVFLYGTSMWIKDQHLDIFFRWVYLPLYAILSAALLNDVI